MAFKLYHNPRCSKSRQALQLLKDNNVDFEIFEYLKIPLPVQGIRELLSKLGLPIRDIIRTKEKEYKDSLLDDKSLSDEHILAIIARLPKLLERPILESDDKAIIGRPPENILKII